MSVTAERRPIGNTVTHCVPVGEILSLRQRILLPSSSLESAVFPGDDDPMTCHVATFLANTDHESIGEPLCCASFLWSELEKESAWQLRGMATDRSYQKHGLGSRLLLWFEQAIIDRGPRRLMWCNARVPAIPFYEKNGWRCISDVFNIPTVGPHRVMTKRA